MENEATAAGTVAGERKMAEGVLVVWTGHEWLPVTIPTRLSKATCRRCGTVCYGDCRS